VSGIRALLERFLAAFAQDTYKEHFSWVDQVNELRDPTQIQRLDAVLTEKIVRREFDRMWLAIPDRVEWEGMSGFKYRDSHRAEIHPDIHFTSFLADSGEHFVPTIDVLKNRRRIYLVSHEADAVVANWPVYLDLSPFLRQPVKRQYPANGGMEHGIVSTKIHA